MEATKPRMFRVLLEVSDIDKAAALYADLLAATGWRSLYGVDPFSNLFCFVDSVTLFTGR